MSETKQSRKSEALALLALLEGDELTTVEDDRLNVLTAEQAGYHVRIEKQTVQGHTVYALLTPEGSVYRSGAYGGEDYIWYPPPEFSTSVDVCLTLPDIEDIAMGTETNRAGVYGWRVQLDSMARAEPFEAFAKTLPIAMLTAWWKMQKDD